MSTSSRLKPPKKPALNSLKGCATISPELREQLGIEKGLLIAKVRSWSNVETLINDYFEHVDDYQLKGDDLFDEVIEALENLSKLKVINEGSRKQKKNGSDRSVVVNDSTIVIPQALLYMEYCKNIKIYLLSPAIKNKFLFHYAKARQAKQKEEERKKRQEEEEEEKAKLIHKGKMNAFLAVESGFIDIQNELQNTINQQMKRKRAVEEEERRAKTRTVSPAPAEEKKEEMNKISFITTTSGGMYEDKDNYVDKDDSHMFAYITSFDELCPISQVDLCRLDYISSHLSLIDRLQMSSITFIDNTNDGKFLPEELDANVLSMVNKFTRAMEYQTKDMLLSPTKIEHINIVSLLNTSFFNICKENDISKYNYLCYESPEQLKNMENNFKIKYVVPFINAVFHANDRLTVDWDAPLDVYQNSDMHIQVRQTADIKFTTIDGIEIGVGEVKPFNTPPEKAEEDRIRLAEISKKMLHKRVLKAKDEKELITFGIMIIGFDVEYYVHEYHPQEPTTTNNSSDAVDKKYQFRFLKKSLLPTFPNTFNYMSLSLEYLTHYKKMMDDSVASASDIEKPYLYSDAYNDFDPTVTLINLMMKKYKLIFMNTPP